MPSLAEWSRRLALPALLILAGAAAAKADPLPVDETTYVERSLNRDGRLTIEHPPVPRNPRGRRAGSRAAIAGFCHDGGHVIRRDEAGRPIVRQREVCDSVAPRTLAPGFVEPRPTWPGRRIVHERALRARG